MKNLIFIFIIFLPSNKLSSQTNIKNNFEICNSDFQLYFKRIYSKDIIDHIKFNRDSSYSYYSDYLTGRNKIVGYRDIDSLKIIPYQYVLIYNVLDVNDDVLTSLKIDCRCYDDLLRMDDKEDYYEVLKPAMEVIKGKALTLREVFDIARKKGYSITEWNLDYEKIRATNEYKKFLPKLVWTLKEKLSEEEGGFYKVLEINAKNGSIMNEYKQLGM